MAQAQAQGTIVQCIGAVIDIAVPARSTCPTSTTRCSSRTRGETSFAEKGLTFEVEQQLGDGVVRSIALGSSDGLRRGMKVTSTGAPISVPVGTGDARPHHGRARPADRRGRPDQDRGAPLDPPAGAQVRRALAVGRAARDRHQGDRPDLPVRQGRQDRPVRRRRRRQDGDHARADQQHRHPARRPVGVRRRGRAHARGQRLLSRDDRGRSHQAGQPRGIQGGDGVRPDERAAGQPPARGADRPDDGRERSATKGRDILLFIDNIYRFTLAGTEVSALLGRMPSAVGYQPTLAEEMGRLQERITSTKTGSITSIQAVYVPADDLTDPSPATTFGHLDATVVLSRDIAVARHLSGGRSARLDLAPGRPERHRRGALQHHARGAGDAAALQGAARHHRDSRHGRAFAGGQARGRARAQDPALPVAAVHGGAELHRHARASTCRSRTRSRASR